MVKPVDTCESLDCGLVSVCNESAGLIPIASPCDGPSPVSGTIVKEFESFLIPSHPPPFDFFLPGPSRELPDGDPILGEPDVVIGNVWLGLAKI